MLFGGLAHPVQRSSVVPALHQRCPTPCFKMTVSPWPGVARLLTVKLKPKLARHNGHGLFLEMVQMHRRTDIRRSQ